MARSIVTPLLDEVRAIELLDALRQLWREGCGSTALSANERVALLFSEAQRRSRFCRNSRKLSGYAVGHSGSVGR